MRWRGLTTLALALLPTFFMDYLRPELRKQTRLHATSYLDGLRGIASLIVSICHYTEDNHGYFVPSWGLNMGPSAFLQLPFVRLIYSGRPMVHIFFIVSGFVLSHKPLRALRTDDVERCHAIIASSAFRRPIRLFGPCIVSTFLILVLSYTGFLYEPLPSLSEQFEDWGNALFRGITWPWAWDFDLRPTYDIHLWTIPIEFSHSMLLLMVLLIVSPLRRVARLLILVAVMTYCLACGRWAAFEFLAGCLFADLQILRDGTQAGLNKPPERLSGKTLSAFWTLRTIAYALLLGAWWFIAGWPNENAERTPGMRLFLRNTPEPFATLEQDERAPQKFWFCVSAMGLVWSVTQVDLLQRGLENKVVQYLGRISYALYIVHGPILNMVQGWVIGHAAVASSGTPGADNFHLGIAGSGIKAVTGDVTPLQQTLAWLMGIVVIWPFMIWAADVFWRFVDLPIIAGARWLESKCKE